jgi:2-iminobutanoate/2-iminopropanoate deaminase
MTHKLHDLGVASQIGLYSDAVEVAGNQRWLITAGTPGLTATGELPDDIKGQSEIAWKHIMAMLDAAGMTVADIIKVTQYLIKPEHIVSYAQVRNRVLAGLKPASMLLVIPQLVRPEFLVEVEIIAVKAQ